MVKKTNYPLFVKNILVALAVAIIPVVPIVVATKFAMQLVVVAFNILFSYIPEMIDIIVFDTYKNVIYSFVCSQLANMFFYLITIFLLVFIFKLALIIGKFADKSILKITKTNIVSGIIITAIAILIYLFYQATIPMGMVAIIPWLKNLSVLHKYQQFAEIFYYNYFPLLAIIMACKAIFKTKSTI